MKIIKQIPNLLTTANLLLGVAGIIHVFTGDYTNTIFFILWAGLFDFLDGFAARFLKVSGDFGKELDSLADMVTFGVLPSLYLFQMAKGAGHSEWIAWTALSVAAFSAYRLARFNTDENQKDSFTGLPTPANAIMLTTCAGIYTNLFDWSFSVPLIALFSSFLLISPIRMMALKFSNFELMQNLDRYIFIVLVVALFLFIGIKILAWIIPIYILISIVGNFTSKTRQA